MHKYFSGLMAGILISCQAYTQSLGNYPDTLVSFAGSNISILPATAPVGLQKIALQTPYHFKGIATIHQTTGKITLTNAYPAGNYTFLVKGIHAGIDTIFRTVQVTVGNANCSQAGFAPSLAVTIPAYHYPLAVGNFNGDDHQDIVTISSTNIMSIRLGDGAGNFTAAGTSAVQADSRQIKVADINNDGHQDVLVANLGSNTVSVRLGDGAGNLSGSTNVSVGTQPHDLAVGDFNSDGHLDFATANYGSNNVTLKMGNSTGTFTNGVTLTAGAQPTNIISGDFNNDGNTDLAVTNGGANNAFVFLGNGLGSFTHTATLSAGNGTVHLVSEDFNKDGTTDLALLNQTGNSISIRLGNGNGTFTNGATLTTGSSPRVVVSADFDGDGRPDLATINSGSSNLTVFYGLGNGQFGHTRTLPASTNPLGLVVGDFNADGMHDLAVLHQTASNNLQVFLGTAGQANITLQGNGAEIANGSTTRSLANHTSFGITSPVTRTYTIKNTGTQPLHVHQIAISGNDAALFTLGNITLPATIAAGSVVTFTVAFSSTTAGEKTAIVTVINNDCDAGLFEFAIGANVAGVTGSALELDGTNEYINIPGFANYNFGGEFTMEAWILKRADKNGGRIIDKGTGGVNDGFILDDVNNLRVIFTHQFISFGQVTVATDVTSPEPLPLNVWHHVAATFSNASKSVSLFLNGKLVASKTISNNIHNLRVNNLPLRIGTAAAGTAPYFQGRIDEVRLWSRALTLCEIQQRMNCKVKDTAAGLIANYHFDQGIARGDNATVTSLTDATGNNRHGTLVNFGLNGGSSNWTGPGAVGNETFCAPTGTTPLSRIFVNAASAGNGNPKTGASWATAFDNLDDALHYLASNTACSTGAAPLPEIWIAGGTYKPVRDEYGTLNPSNGRLKTFLLNQPVSIYGGFKGTENSIAQYTPGTPTILSGDIGLPNDSADNAFHVVTALKDGLKNVTLQNLVITEGFVGGNLTRNNIRSFYGGGLYNRGVELTLRNVIFHNNRSDDLGGALYNDLNAATRCEQVIFTENYARNNGGAVAQSSGLASSYLHNVFYKNTTGMGAGAALFHQSAAADDQPLFTNTIVYGNRGAGAAISPLLNAGKATYSIMQDNGITGAGISFANPLFTDSLLPAGPDGIWMTADDGLQPNACEAIDKGSNTASAAINTDITGAARRFEVSVVPDGGLGTAPVTDLGAYERSLVFSGPGTISLGNLTMPTPFETKDTIRSTVDPGIFPNAVYSWEKDENLGLGWRPATPDTSTFYYPLDSIRRSTKLRRVVSICGIKHVSNEIAIKIIKPEGGISGQVLSKNGFPVKGIVVEAKKKNDLPGSPEGFVYRDTTGDDGRYSIGPIYYGDPDNTPSTVFEIRPLKDGHSFNIPLLERTLSNAFKTFADVNFVDNTVFSVSGSTVQTCKDCLLEDNSTGTKNCPINEVDMRVNGGFQVKSTSINDEPGRYSITITDPREYTFSARFRTRDFLPKDTAINVTGDITGLVFTDTTTRLITGRVSAGCGDNLGTATLEFRDTGMVSCFRKIVVTDNLGNFSVRLPARAYRAEIKDITLKAGSTDNKPDVMTFFSSILPKDSLYRDITDRDTTLFIVYQRAPTMVITDGLDPVNDCATVNNRFALIPQISERPIQIKVFQGSEVQNCPATDTTLRIFTNIQVEDVNEELVYRTLNGEVKDTLTGGNPNIIAPYFKTFNPVFKDVFGREVSLTRKVVVTGVKANTGTFTTISPEVPLLVLHDPPGDRSKSSWSQSVSNQTTLRMYVGKTQGAELWSQIKIGTAFSAGLGFSVPTKIWGSIGGMFGVSQKMNTVNESTITTTTTQTYATSDDPSFTGDNGDLFVGGALNLRYSAADELSYDPDSCKLSLRKTLAVGNEGFATTYNYTQSFIEKNLIPEQLASSTNPSLTPAQRDNFANSVKVWQQVLANNEANKKRAKFESNRSFSAGSTNTFTSTSRSSKTSTVQFDMEINTQLALELGVDIGGSGFSGGTKVRMKMESGQSQTGVVTNETTTSYTLQDDDAGDNFSVDVKRDPVYNTPVFELVAGTSSCPTEPGTRPRGEMQLTIDEPTQSGIATDGEALFFLKLGNTSQSNEARTYRLSFVQASNPNGAIITIGGSPILTGIDYNIAYLGEVQVAVSVKKNPASAVFSYEGLEFVLSDACGGNISKTAKLSAYFNSPCSPVTLTAPQNGWVANSLINNLLPISFKDYLIANLQTVSLEYSPVGSNSWITAFTRNSGQLPNSASGAEVNWNITNVAEGEYNLRLKLVCANGTIYSERVTGVIDRVGPLVLGKPDPTDDDFVNGDLIGARFIENINTASLGDGKVRLIRAATGQRISSTVTGYVNQLVLVPNEPINSYAGESFLMILEGVKDIYGNQKAVPDTFRFKVGGSIASTANNAVNLSIRNQNIPENAGTPAPPPGGGKAALLGGNDTAIVVVFELPVNTPIPVRINYAIGGSAIYLQDYKISYDSVAPSASNTFDGSLGSIVIASGTRKAVLRIRPVDNNGFNPDKTIVVSALEGGDYELGGAVQVKGVILNEEEPIKYIFTGNGNFSDVNQWQDGNKPPAVVPYGVEIIINPAGDGTCTLNTPLTMQPGSKLTIPEGKKLVVASGVSIIQY